jgi:pyridoxine 4-dehydrogenase
MQLAGPHVFGPPRDRPEAIAVLREAVASGVNHIDTSDFYGSHVTNQIIKEVLHPYPKDLTLVTKVGSRRGADGSWIPDRSRENLVESIHDNLRNLGLEALDIVNLRMGGFSAPEPRSIAEPMKIVAAREPLREAKIRIKTLFINDRAKRAFPGAH